jgi:hypothetical protein
MLPVGGHFDAARTSSKHDVCVFTHDDSLNRGRALSDDARVLGIERNAKLPHATAVGGDASVAEVDPEEIAVGVRIEQRQVMETCALVRFGIA